MKELDYGKAKLSDWRPSNNEHIEGLTLEELEIIGSYLIPHHMFDIKLNKLFKKVCHEIVVRSEDEK